MKRLKMSARLGGLLALGLCTACQQDAPPAVSESAAAPAPAVAASTTPAAPIQRPTLIANARIFDGRSDALTGPMNVLVEGNTITRIAASIEAPAGATVIDAGGRTLMPGLIDAHTHLMMSTVPMQAFLAGHPGYWHVAAGKGATEMLMRGFTSAREAGGPVFGLKRAIDEGIIPGPRIWPAGATISQTAGHADYRTVLDLPWPEGAAHFSERLGGAAIADGPDQVMRRVREQLMQGASQIKMMAGGGVASNYDPLDVTQYTEGELRAGVEAARAWGTYVLVHAYTPDAIQAAINAGVKCIDHGQLADAASAQLMAEKGVWWSLQPFLDDEDAIPFPEGSANRLKQIQMTKGTENAYALAKRFGVKTAFGTDTLFDASLAPRQGAQLAKLARWYTPAQVLKMATGDNAELLALSGNRSPYPGRLGVVEEGALADLLVVDGDPIADLQLIADPARNFLVIMKDGIIYKNDVGPGSQNP